MATSDQAKRIEELEKAVSYLQQQMTDLLHSAGTQRIDIDGIVTKLDGVHNDIRELKVMSRSSISREEVDNRIREMASEFGRLRDEFLDLVKETHGMQVAMMTKIVEQTEVMRAHTSSVNRAAIGIVLLVLGWIASPLYYNEVTAWFHYRFGAWPSSVSSSPLVPSPSPFSSSVPTPTPKLR